MKNILEEYGLTLVELIIGAIIISSLTVMLLNFGAIAEYLCLMMIGE